MSRKFNRGGGGKSNRPGRHSSERNERSQRSGGDSHNQRTPARGPGLRRLKATVDKNRKGFGFLAFEDRRYEDAFIPPREAQSLFHGDRVEVTVGSDGDVMGIRVLAHRFREVVGRYTPHEGQRGGGFIVYERKRAREEIHVPPFSGTQPQSGDWVQGKLQFHTSGAHNVTAEISKIFGPELPASADLGMVAAEFNLVEEHSDAAEAQARAYTLDLEKTLKDPHRKDLRNIPFITIDGETARDFDDAIFVEKKGQIYILWVAIADVSHYVTEGTPLDEDAKSRGTSVYFPEKAFHMLPRALSENLCSLKPNEPRLTLVSRMEIDREGTRLKTEVLEGVIESRRRATYNEIQSEWEKNQKNPAWEFTPHFELYQIFRKARGDRGSIDFDLPEAEIRVDEQGVPISITQRPRLDAHRLIEEFMISANESVTEWALERNWPFIYRVHETPARDSLERFRSLAATVGVGVVLDESADLPQQLNEVVRRVAGHPAQEMLNTALLRSMKQAIYSADHGGHFGLASQGYTHFTSPIRRYPDLIVHRQLRRALRLGGKKLSSQEEQTVQKELESIAEHCSYRERIASDAEREAIKLKQVRAMIPQLGNEFEGKIVGMAEAGLFMQILNPYCEGMVAVESLIDDAYQFDEDRMIFQGRRKKRQFKLGDRIPIKCIRADIERRQVDFVFVESLAAGLDPDAMPERQKQSERLWGGGGKGRERNERGGAREGRRGERNDWGGGRSSRRDARDNRGGDRPGGRGERPGPGERSWRSDRVRPGTVDRGAAQSRDGRDEKKSGQNFPGRSKRGRGSRGRR